MDYKKVLRLHNVDRLSSREIARLCNCGKTTVNDFIARFNAHPELSYPLSEDITNEFIEQALYQKPGNQVDNDLYRPFSEEAAYRALTKKGETLKHLWQQYNAVGEVDGKKPLSYRQYCRRYSAWLENGKVTFHIPRYPGINMELDYAGKTLGLRSRSNPEEITKVTVFVAALSYSNYFYVEGMTSCDIGNWIRVNNNALKYFGGVTQTVTPDNCKVAVTENKDWIDPVINKDFQAWADHNGTVITPAKVKSPRWKPNVEGHVKIITMHILVEMETMTFYSLEELNEELWRRMEQENRANLSGLSYSRRDLFSAEEKDSLLPLPESPYEYLVRKKVKVAPDFSFVIDKVHYSMPRKYLRKELDVRAGEKKIYVYNENGDLIRTHERSYTPKSWVVIPSDMPKEYNDYGYWNVPFFLQKAADIGPDTRLLIERVISKFDYPVQSFRSCYGILKYAEKYGKETLELCCHDALVYGKCNYTYITNTITSYIEPNPEAASRAAATSEPHRTKASSISTGTYKDDDSQYSIQNLLKRQEEGDLK